MHLIPVDILYAPLICVLISTVGVDRQANRDFKKVLLSLLSIATQVETLFTCKYHVSNEERTYGNGVQETVNQHYLNIQ